MSKHVVSGSSSPSAFSYPGIPEHLGQIYLNTTTKEISYGGNRVGTSGAWSTRAKVGRSVKYPTDIFQESSATWEVNTRFTKNGLYTIVTWTGGDVPDYETFDLDIDSAFPTNPNLAGQTTTPDNQTALNIVHGCLRFKPAPAVVSGGGWRITSNGSSYPAYNTTGDVGTRNYYTSGTQQYLSSFGIDMAAGGFVEYKLATLTTTSSAGRYYNNSLFLICDSRYHQYP